MKPLSKIKFYAIRRDIESATGGRSVGLSALSKKAIAHKHHVSVETVRVVNVTRTWPKFEDYKVKKHLQYKNRVNRQRASVAATKRVRHPMVLVNGRALDDIRKISKNSVAPDPRAPINGDGLEGRVLDLEIKVARLEAQRPRNFRDRLFGRSY